MSRSHSLPAESSELCGPDLLLYDGTCGLCHRAVRLALARTSQNSFVFAPLGGATFTERVRADLRDSLPDSMAILRSSGELLDRGAAAIHLGRQLGGSWSLLARAVSCLPLSWVDAAYDLVAKLRHRIFSRPQTACPVADSELRIRFLP